MSERNTRVYTEEETQEILRLAGHLSPRSDALTRSDLVRAAAEIGVPEEVVTRAEKLVREQQSDSADREEFRRHSVRSVVTDLIAVLALAVPFYLSVGQIWFVVGLVSGAVRTTLELLVGQSTGSEQKFDQWKLARLTKSAFTLQDGEDPLIEVVVAGRKRVKRNDLLDWLIYIRKLEYGRAIEMIDQFATNHPDVEIVG